MGKVNFIVKFSPTLETIKNDPGMIERRVFYSSSKADDYLSYCDDGCKENFDYINYTENKDKTPGVFNENGLMSSKDKAEYRKMLRNTQSVIWDGIISFEKDFGITRCGTYEQAYELVKKELPRFFKNAGLNPENIIWFAALHTNTDNRHIHFSFFEKLPLRFRQRKEDLQYSTGFIPQRTFDKAKIDIEMRLNEWNTRLAGVRKDVTTNFKKVLENERKGELEKNMIILSTRFPTSGRLKYDSNNILPLRPIIDSIVDLTIQLNPNLSQCLDNFITIIKEKDIAIAEACEKNKIIEDKYLLYPKYIKDIYRRLGNIVLNSIEYIKIKQSKLDIETKNKLVKKRIEKLKKRKLLDELAYLTEKIDKEAKKIFEEFIRKMETFNYQRLIDEGQMT